MALAVSRFTQSDKNAIGDVKDSILTEAQFVAENGPEWCLADGRSIVGSKLHQKYGFTTAVDIRGLFRRAKNNGRSDGNQDPGGERAVGNFQNQATAKNGLTASSSDSGHVHGGTYDETGAFNPASAGGGLTDLIAANTDIGFANITTTISSSDAETRPRNMAFNVFIKIN